MKRSELAEYIKETIVDVLSEAEGTEEEIVKTKELTKAVQDLQKAKEEAGLAEDIDDEDTAAQQATVDTKDSVSVISRKLQDTTKEMKTTVNKWKQAEGEEKERLLARLKDLTKIKKELEGLL
jgi:uncharacterized protein (DUF3084 family)